MVRPSIDWIIRLLVKVGAKVVYHARRWHAILPQVFLSLPTTAYFLPDSFMQQGNLAYEQSAAG
jgi:hypothetical protein